MNKYAVSEESLTAILNYLATRPYVEVYKILPLLQEPNIEALEASKKAAPAESQENAS